MLMRPTKVLNHVSSYVESTCYVVHRLDRNQRTIYCQKWHILPILNHILEDKNINVSTGRDQVA